MSQEISRDKAIALITAAISTVYSECFKEQKRELSEGVRRAITMAGQVRNNEEKNHALIESIKETNSQIGELSNEAQQVLEIFNGMVSASEYNHAEMMDRLKNAGLKINRLEKALANAEIDKAEALAEAQQNNIERIRDLERTITSKDKVLASNSDAPKALKTTQRELDSLRMKYKELQTSFDTMEMNFKSNANKLIERIKEVNQLKEATKSVGTNEKELTKELQKAKKEACHLQCKVGSIDYARKEWKRKYEELYIQYQALLGEYESQCGMNERMMNSVNQLRNHRRCRRAA